jgi:NADH-quinone oxidoreductase subunit N
LLAGLWAVAVTWGDGSARSSFFGLFLVDPFALAFKFVILLGTALSLLLADSWLAQRRLSSGATYSLVLMASSGMMYMVSAGDLVMLFLGLEVMSIPIYCLAGSLRWDDRSVESGVKYLVLGSFATALFLFGLALLYAHVGITTGHASTLLSEIRASLNVAPGPLPGYAIAGGLLTLVGLLFKISAAPFHMWTPDVYEGAPTPITAYMSVAVKATAAAVLLRVFGGNLLAELQLDGLFWAVAALTMVLGNVMALVQDNLKRMLAYASIAHGGYILLGVLAGSAEGEAGVVFYVLAYTAANVAAFGVLLLLSRHGHEVERFEDLRGLGSRYPLAGVIMTLSMLSLIGIPPFAGFFGKFQVFAAAVSAGYVGLAVIGLLSSAVSFAYYLRPTLVMFMQAASARERRGPPSTAPSLIEGRPALVLSLLVATMLVLALGLLPGSALRWAAASVLAQGG